ncbi:hypothetical protein HPP92_017074 [Vanilla planifolia]|uniref:Uncharacterized protein n=1 Tax=Vanilla planifolia TaxID=51239 RepID=A0A835QBK4_VANPL|nr:hypothetical protein HPP92_017074 [Vanilla planifolia]
MLRKIGTPETTAQVHPQQLYQGTAVLATAEHGVQVVYGDAEDRTKRDGGQCCWRLFPRWKNLVGGRGGACPGPWSGRLPLVSLFNVSGPKAHSIVLRPQGTQTQSHPTPSSSGTNQPRLRPDPEVYPRPTGEVYICGLKGGYPTDDPEEIVGEPGSIAMLHEIAATVSNHLKVGGAELVAEQACFLPCTDDGLPGHWGDPWAKGHRLPLATAVGET